MIKMQKKILVIGIIIVLGSIGLSGCTREKRESLNHSHNFIGTWTLISEGVKGNITFLSNGSGNWYNRSITWNIEEDKLVIEGDWLEQSNIYNFTFTKNIKILKIKNIAHPDSMEATFQKVR